MNHRQRLSDSHRIIRTFHITSANPADLAFIYPKYRLAFCVVTCKYPKDRGNAAEGGATHVPPYQLCGVPPFPADTGTPMDSSTTGEDSPNLVPVLAPKSGNRRSRACVHQDRSHASPGARARLENPVAAQFHSCSTPVRIREDRSGYRSASVRHVPVR